MKLVVVNSMRDKMFEVDIPASVVSAFAPRVFITQDPVWQGDHWVEGKYYSAIDYNDFKGLADQMYI